MAFALCIAFKMLMTILTLIILSSVIRYEKSSKQLFATPMSVRCCCGSVITRSTASLWKELNSCWQNAAVASLEFWNPLVTNASSSLFASFFSSLNAFARVWQTTQLLLYFPGSDFQAECMIATYLKNGCYHIAGIQMVSRCTTASSVALNWPSRPIKNRLNYSRTSALRVSRVQ